MKSRSNPWYKSSSEKQNREKANRLFAHFWKIARDDKKKNQCPRFYLCPEMRVSGVFGDFHVSTPLPRDRTRYVISDFGECGIHEPYNIIQNKMRDKDQSYSWFECRYQFLRKRGRLELACKTTRSHSHLSMDTYIPVVHSCLMTVGREMIVSQRYFSRLVYVRANRTSKRTCPHSHSTFILSVLYWMSVVVCTCHLFADTPDFGSETRQRFSCRQIGVYS